MGDIAKQVIDAIVDGLEYVGRARTHPDGTVDVHVEGSITFTAEQWAYFDTLLRDADA